MARTAPIRDAAPTATGTPPRSRPGCNACTPVAQVAAMGGVPAGQPA